LKLISFDEFKMVNAIMYFAKNVKNPFKLKIFKLLYFLDFMHFSQVGKSVTNQNYIVFEKGPVPDRLYRDMENNRLSDYFNKNIVIMKRKFGGEEFKAKKNADLKLFSQREKEIMEKLVVIFKNAKSDDMSEATHLENLPWEITKNKKGLFSEIDYILAIDENSLISKELALERIKSNKEMKEIFG